MLVKYILAGSMEFMEPNVLYLLLAVAFVLAPWMTNSFFLRHSKLYSDLHRLVLAALIVSAILNVDWLVVVWPIFCIFGYLFYLKNECISLSVTRLTAHLPFVFSLISSLWFVTGVLDLKMLGYNPTFSFYAALHGAYLGWMFVGCFAFLSQKANSPNFYSYTAYICFVCFLLVAFGIEGVPYIKAIGTVGLSIVVPLAIFLYVLRLSSQHRLARVLASLSLLAILASMSLALLNEFWPGLLRIFYGMPTMVLVHGTLNAVFALPLFLLAVELADNREKEISDSIVLFDGFCVLCNSSVDLLMKFDTKGRLRYSALQGQFAQAKLDRTKLGDVDSVIFLKGGQIYKKSEAVIQILKRVGGVYGLLGFILGILPFFILDRLYDLAAQNRYRIFGKRDECRIPGDKDKGRIIL